MPSKFRGFTLIELLVVIAIIGVLASVILLPLSSARKKAKDSHLISDVQQIRVGLESTFNGTNFNAAFTAAGAAHSFVNSGPFPNILADVVTYGTSGVAYGTVAFNDASGLIFVDNSVVAGGVFTTGLTFYAIRAKLNSGNYFCIDYNGKTNQSEPAPGAGNWATTCQ